MNIQPTRLTIAQLFTPQNEQFVIPSYQRRYAWGYYQFAALFDDINILLENDNHLFGMLIFHSGNHHGGLNKVELVDGQQRITTLTILLNAIKDRYTELGNTDKEKKIEDLLMCKGYDEVAENKLILGALDNEDYKKILSGDLKNVKNTNLLEADNYFRKWLQEFDNIELNKFYSKLTNVAIVIRLDVGLAQDAYKLFETINNRGLRLTPTDIIKNFLLGHAAKINQGTLDKVKSLWSDIILNLDGINTDDFFRQYMCSILQRKITKNKLVHEFKSMYFNIITEVDVLGESAFYDKIEDEIIESVTENPELNEEQVEEVIREVKENKISLIELLSELRESSEVYQKIIFEKFESKRINRHLHNLNRILSVPTYIFLVHLFQKDLPEKTIVEILKVLETFMMRRHICEMRTSEHDDIFAKIVQVEVDDNYVQNIKDFLFEYLPDDVDFKVSFPKYDFKGIVIRRAKYILENFENRLTGDTNEKTVNGGKDVHLEHIIPETITTKKSKREYGDWEEYLGENSKSLHKKYIHKIGNMTLLAGDLNIKAYNNPFSKKKGCYRASALKITNELSSYNNFRFRQVEERSKDLAELALEIWSF